MTCVVIDHLSRIWYDKVLGVTPSEFGMFGVYLFFVHTSLVLMSSIERRGQHAGWVRHFYTRRAFRIYPLAWVTVALVITAGIPVFVYSLSRVTPYSVPTAGEVLANLALVQNFVGKRDLLAPLWSLPIEVQMYTMLPAAFLLTSGKLRYLTFVSLAGLAASLFAWYALLGGVSVPFIWRLNVLLYVPCFTSGIWAYRLLRSRRRETRGLPAWTFPLALLVSFGTLIASLRIAGNAWAWLSCAVIGVAIPTIQDARVSWATEVAGKIALYSYGVYLMHSLAIVWGILALRNFPPLVQACVFTSLIVSLPWLAYRLIEKPGIDLGIKVSGALTTRLAETAV